jgi:hypothetical protein
MSVSCPVFSPLPTKEELQEAIELHERHLADLTSYLWYIMPVADRFGESVYDVSADALTKSGIPTSAGQLKMLAAELKTPEGMQRYADNRRIHIGTNVTSYKGRYDVKGNRRKERPT